jgi:hypothetical protein
MLCWLFTLESSLCVCRNEVGMDGTNTHSHGERLLRRRILKNFAHTRCASERGWIFSVYVHRSHSIHNTRFQYFFFLSSCPPFLRSFDIFPPFTFLRTRCVCHYIPFHPHRPVVIRSHHHIISPPHRAQWFQVVSPLKCKKNYFSLCKKKMFRRWMKRKVRA